MNNSKPETGTAGLSLSMELFRSFVEKQANEILNDELVDWMAEIARESGETPVRNGYYSRTVQTPLGPLDLRIPRDRAGLFRTALLDPYQRRMNDVDELIVRLYGQGLTVEEVAEVIAAQTGSPISASTVQKIVSGVYGRAEEFNSRELPDCPVVFLDGTWLPLKRVVGHTGEYDSECVMVALGFRPDGRKEILGFRISAGEGARAWRDFLEDLRGRGLNSPMLFVTDGLNGMRQAIGEVFPDARHQTCLIHVQRNLARAVGKRKGPEIATDFARLFRASDTDEAERMLDAFIDRWGSYKQVRELRNNRSLFTFLLFPEKARTSLYSTNAIEGFNSKLKRDLRKRISLKSEGQAVYLIAHACDEFNSSKRAHPIRGYHEMTDEELAVLGMER